MESIYLGFLIASVLVLFASLICYLVYRLAGKKHNKKLKELVKFFIFVSIGVFLSAALLFYPLYSRSELPNDTNTFVKVVESILLSLHNTIRLFILDGDYIIVRDALEALKNSTGNDVLANIYGVYTAIIYVIAPFLTFSFIFAIIANFKSNIKFYFAVRSNNKKVFIFSELNRKSILLAESIRKTEKYKKCVIVFASTDQNDEDLDSDLVDRAKEIKALLFKKEVTSLSYGKKVVLPKSKIEEKLDENKEFNPLDHIPEKESRRISLFFMHQDAQENVRQYYDIFKELKKRGDVTLYLFSTNATSDLALSHFNDNDTYVICRRVTVDNFFIYRYLFEKGHEIFDSANKIYHVDGKEDRKIISAVIIGLGSYGTQFLGALSWYCQMNGYYLKINAFDGDTNAEDKIAGIAPELLDEHNKQDIFGDAQYDITIHSGVFTKTKKFNDIIKSIDDVSICYTCLGQDEANIEAAIELRMLFERNNLHPIINAIVQDLDADVTLNAVNYNYDANKNPDKGKYDINFIGDDITNYSVESIIDSELEELGKRAHVMWSSSIEGVREDVEKFYRYNYFYLSSCASAIHTDAKKYCKIPGMDKPNSERTDEEKKVITVLEHSRWNAWMRSQGYIYSGSRDKSSRNDLAKKHNDLVNFSELSKKDIKKDEDVTS